MDATPEMIRTPREPVRPEAVSPALFAHFVVRTSNFEAMRAWLQTVLNARIVHDNGTLCFMTYDDEHHRLALVNVPGLQKPAADNWGLNHVAYSYRTMRDLLSTYVRLRDEGISAVPADQPRADEVSISISTRIGPGSSCRSRCVSRPRTQLPHISTVTRSATIRSACCSIQGTGQGVRGRCAGGGADASPRRQGGRQSCGASLTLAWRAIPHDRLSAPLLTFMFLTAVIGEQAELGHVPGG